MIQKSKAVNYCQTNLDHVVKQLRIINCSLMLGAEWRKAILLHSQDSLIPVNIMSQIRDGWETTISRQTNKLSQIMICHKLDSKKGDKRHWSVSMHFRPIGHRATTSPPPLKGTPTQHRMFWKSLLKHIHVTRLGFKPWPFAWGVPKLHAAILFLSKYC